MGTATDSTSVGRASVGRGSALLLDHCGRLDRLMGGGRRPGRERLEELIGPDLASSLVRALSGDHRLVTPRWADYVREAVQER